jgi:TolA-binding protein
MFNNVFLKNFKLDLPITSTDGAGGLDTQAPPANGNFSSFTPEVKAPGEDLTKTDVQPSEKPKSALEEQLNNLQKRFEEREKFWSSKFDQKNTEAQKQAKEKEEALKARMTAEEKFKYEIEEREKALAEKENAIKIKENEIVKRDTLKEHDLLDFVDFDFGSDKETIETNATKLKGYIDKKLNLKIEEFYSKNGYKPTENKDKTTISYTYDQLSNLSDAQIDALGGVDKVLAMMKKVTK